MNVQILSSAAVVLSLQYATCKSAVHTQVLHDEKAHSARIFRLRGFQCNETLNVTVRDGQLIQFGEFNEGKKSYVLNIAFKIRGLVIHLS